MIAYEQQRAEGIDRHLANCSVCWLVRYSGGRLEGGQSRKSKEKQKEFRRGGGGKGDARGGNEVRVLSRIGSEKERQAELFTQSFIDYKPSTSTMHPLGFLIEGARPWVLVLFASLRRT